MTALWLTVALMTGAAVFVVLGSLARRREVPADAAEADVAVYRDQIDEIARDRARGLIDKRDADSARVEVARRLIAASDRGGLEAEAAPSVRRRRVAAVIALVGLPLVSLGGYAVLGSPGVPDQPLAARAKQAPDVSRVADMVSRVEAALAKNPDDGRGWEVIAPIYLGMGRADDAAGAYRNVIRLLGSTPDRQANLGEALFAAAEGVVTQDARIAFERSVEGDAPSIKGSLYLARAAQQDGDLPAALARLKTLMERAPKDAPYLGALKDELQRMAEVPPLPLPTGAEAEALKTPEQRMAKVREMVDALGDRLAGEGGDLGEWLRLARARAVLGDTDKARAAIEQARAKFSGDGRAAARLDALALGLGLEGRGA